MDSRQLTSEEKRGFKAFLANSSMYMDENEKLTEHDFEHYNRTEFSLRENDERYNSFRERFKEMILVDYKYNGFALSKYKDIYDEARNDYDNLKEQASVSGIEKVFKDLTGSKKKAAQARLDRINDKKRRFREGEEEKARQYIDSTYSSINMSEYNSEAQKMKDKYAELEEEAERIKQIPKENRTKEQRDLLDVCTRVQNKSLYFKNEVINRLSDGAQLVNSVTYQVFHDKEGEKFPGDKIFRDVARWSTKIGDTSSINKEYLFSKVDSLYTVIHDGVNKDGEKVSEEEHREAITDILETLSMNYTDLKARMESNQELFGDNPNPVLVVKNYGYISELFKMGQPLDDVSKAVLKSKSMGKMTEQQKTNLKEWFMFFEAFHMYTFGLDKFFHAWTDCLESGIKDYENGPEEMKSFQYWLSCATPILK